MKTIGIIGGVGPFAGIDLMEKVLAQTNAKCDQEHIPMVLYSFPHLIPDRSAFLLGKSPNSPVKPLLNLLESVARAGATVIGIPCHTSHSPVIFEPLKTHATLLEVHLLSIVEETVKFVQEHYPRFRRLGLLATAGTYHSGVYEAAFVGSGIEIILPDSYVQTEVVHRLIYEPSWGIKAVCCPVSAQAQRLFGNAVKHLREKDVDGVLLACTELPLAANTDVLGGLTAIDPTVALARALIREAEASKLCPL